MFRQADPVEAEFVDEADALFHTARGLVAGRRVIGAGRHRPDPGKARRRYCALRPPARLSALGAVGERRRRCGAPCLRPSPKSNTVPGVGLAEGGPYNGAGTGPGGAIGNASRFYSFPIL